MNPTYKCLFHDHIGPKISTKIKIYILSRAKLLCSLCHEIPCTYGAPPPQGGSSYVDSEKKVSFESIVLSREASIGSQPSTAGRPSNGQKEAAFVLEDTVAIKYLVEPSIDSILLSIEPQKNSE